MLGNRWLAGSLGGGGAVVASQRGRRSPGCPRLVLYVGGGVRVGDCEWRPKPQIRRKGRVLMRQTWVDLLQGRSIHPRVAKGCGNGLTVLLLLEYRRLAVVERGWLEGMESGQR